jgi:type II secretory pathway pseudopilin PulG
VELLVATICLSITAFGILTAIGFADNQNTLSRQRMTALAIASSAMEGYRSQAYANNLAPGTYTTSLGSSTLPKPAQQIVTITATSDPVVFNVTVQVNWTVTLSSGATTRGVHLDTALRNNDVP